MIILQVNTKKNEGKMDSQIQPIVEIANLNTKLFLNCFENVDEQIVKKQPNNKTNNMIFIACHLLDARYYLGNFIGLKLDNPFKELFDSANSIADMKEYPLFQSIKSEWEKISSHISGKLSELDKDFLQKETKQSFPVNDKTILGAISFLVGHEAYHIGQLSILRKFFGLEAMKY